MDWEKLFDKEFRCSGGVKGCEIPHESMPKNMSETEYKKVKDFIRTLLSRQKEEAVREEWDKHINFCKCKKCEESRFNEQVAHIGKEEGKV